MGITNNLKNRGLIGDGLKRASYRYPSRQALIYYDSEGKQTIFTYEELNKEVNRVAHSLLEMGVKKGDRIAAIGRNSPEMVLLSYALLKIGAWYTPLNFMLKPQEISQLINISQTRMFFVDRANIGAVKSIVNELHSVEKFVCYRTDEVPEGWGDFNQLVDGGTDELEIEIDDKDVAALFYTSGTESVPKGVMVTHRNFFYSNYSYMAAGVFQPEDTLLLTLPLIHMAGFTLMLHGHMVGLTIVMTEVPIPSQMATLMEEHKITLTALPPTLYLGILNVEKVNQYDYSALQKLVTWSSTIPKGMVDGWNRIAPNAQFFTIQGSSETTASPLTGSWFKTWDDVPNGDGRYVGKVVHTGSEIKLVDDYGNEVPNGIPGEQLARGPVVVKGYFNNEEANMKAFQNGWYHTGDVLIRDNDGNYFFADRKKDIVKTGGENVSSQEIENILSSHSEILQCAVFGVPDPRWGEAITAAIVLRDGSVLTKEEIIDYCKGKLSGYKIPKYFVFRSSLPTTSAGKLLKRTLKDEYKSLAQSFK
ncbi:AMP-binding protein [Bacillus sp. DTU_2020_1000418_1_SI_GHA_SEK_038]|uniref:class I adenylate-forming enzyme family protein n=1 Tax=Bacillus sp. DTU_2020_1000418_1_SI_GHA_SEK_038 TaxID=3077585 RepID=UPI0028EEDC18|nr:AMP-binding protein [Bacillus sp. DTU_2020_1000418_1_SI_GHA_SEK_038]WNS76175.1 AMP-binding protein [Bacillus sp. DTU_2020_1000418_1_SI_GHA_SEK_038]